MASLGLADAVVKNGVVSSTMCFQNEKGKVLAQVKERGETSMECHLSILREVPFMRSSSMKWRKMTLSSVTING